MNTNGLLVAGVDLGGTNIHGALADADGTVVCEQKVATASHEGPERVLARIAALVEALAAQVGARPHARARHRSGQAPRLHDLTGGDANQVTTETMAEAARGGDEAVALAFARAGEWLGIGTANMVTALHPEIVVIGGGVALAGDLLLPAVIATMRQRVRMFPADSVRVEISQLGDRAGLLGGIALAARGADFLTATTTMNES